MVYFAHPGHPLLDHLNSVAGLAREFASAFASAEWGYLAGLWHDFGKFQHEFQRRLAGEKIAVEHSGAGAALAAQKAIHSLAFVIAGHHAGMANPVASLPDGPKPLRERVEENRELLGVLRNCVPEEILAHDAPPLPAFLQASSFAGRVARENAARQSEFWVRFLFSALTDADYLDTEAFLEPAKAVARRQSDSLASLLPKLESVLAAKTASISDGQRELPINRARTAVADACRRAWNSPPGLFSLTAPTGAGKTLAAMLFALGHARMHDQRRVIVVLPYTSIIEQNAQVYRSVFGDGNVIEHHCNYDPPPSELTTRNQLATENWDAPVIVTTTVQFFESLFSNRSSRCRKLHNIARSTVILDEVQSLPPGVLLPILDALNELASNYGCSIVLSTATPPALCERSGMPQGLRNVREIIPDPSSLAHNLKRVRYHWPANGDETWEHLAERISRHDRVLAVVHRREDARHLAILLKKLCPQEADSVFHLSALMCPAHRSDVLARVREVLAAGQPCRLVSTQLIEAGVDIDFPVLYRALAGVDSIVQAAGRCNREGLVAEGEVFVFRAPTLPPQGVLRKGYEIMATFLSAQQSFDPSDPEASRDYFRKFYFASTLDQQGIQSARAGMNFATVARDFRIIEDGCTMPLVVPYGDALARLAGVRRMATKEGLRSLQPYTVRIYPQAAAQLRQAGALDEICEGLWATATPFTHLYDKQYGFVLNAELEPDPASLVI